MATSAESKPNRNSRRFNSQKEIRGGDSYRGELKGGGDNDNSDDEDCDMEVMDTLSTCIRQAQSVLDQNRSLIKQVNENQRSMIPENLTKNVPLLSEINRNVSKVISIYSDLSVNFSNLVQERRRIDNGSSVEKTGA